MMVSESLNEQPVDRKESLVSRSGFGSLIAGVALSAGFASGADLGLRDLEGIRADLKERSATLEVADSTDPLLCLLGIQVPNALRVRVDNPGQGNEKAMRGEDFRAIPFDQIPDLQEFSLINNPFILDRDLVGLAQTSVRRVEIVGGVIDGSFLRSLPIDTVEDIGVKDVLLKSDNLKELKRYPNLKVLSFLSAGVDDEALALVAQAPALKTVVVKGSGVTMEGVLTLCRNPSVGFVGVDLSRYPTAKELGELDEFCQKRPHLKVVITVVRNEERLTIRMTSLGLLAQRDQL